MRTNYEMLSSGHVSVASPIMFNAGSAKQQTSSCYVLDCEDNLESIVSTVARISLLARGGGGIGLSLANIRSRGSRVGCEGVSEGVLPIMKKLNTAASTITQGENKRPCAIAVYLPMWHADIYEFLSTRKTIGDTAQRTYSLFLGAWVSDLFMARVKAGEKWSLMTPNLATGLSDVHGQEFVDLYKSYEAIYDNGVPTVDSPVVRQVDARDLFSYMCNVIANRQSSIAQMAGRGSVMFLSAV